MDQAMNKTVVDYLDALEAVKNPELTDSSAAVTVTCRMDTGLLGILDNLSEKIGQSRSAFMVQILRDNAYDIAKTIYTEDVIMQIQRQGFEKYGKGGK